MTIDITAKIHQSLNNLTVITDPKFEEILQPNYELYCCAPFLLPAQASCLLAGLATMDWETVYSLITLRDIERDINRGLQAGGKLTPPQSSDGKWSFHDYVIYSFPIPHDSLDYLKNIYALIQKAVERGFLKHTPFINPDGIQEKLLIPEDIVKYAKEIGIEIPEAMTIALKNIRPSVKALKLPKIFPNQINFGFEYRVKRIKANQKIAALMPSSNVELPSPKSYEQHRKHLGLLSSDEKKLPLKELVLRIAHCIPRVELLNGEGTVQLKQLLSKHAPCKKTLFHQTIWHPVQLALAFYGIDYHTILDAMKEFSDLQTQFIILVDVARAIDGEERIFENFGNYVIAKDIQPLKVSVEDFTTFVTANSIQLPHYWPKPSYSSNPPKFPIKESLRGKKPETLRKEIMARCAELARKFAERNSTTIPKPSALARNKNMRALVKMLNEIGGLDPVEGDIDPEWLSPEDKKS